MGTKPFQSGSQTGEAPMITRSSIRRRVMKIAHGRLSGHSIATDILALTMIHNLLTGPVLRRSVSHPVLIWHGVVYIGQVGRFWIFLKYASRLLPENLSEMEVHNCRCHFRAFQLELAILGTENIGNGPVVAKLQPFQVGRISKKRVLPQSESHFCTHKKKNTANYLRTCQQR